jgi:hypothetical protein
MCARAARCSHDAAAAADTAAFMDELLGAGAEEEPLPGALDSGTFVRSRTSTGSTHGLAPAGLCCAVSGAAISAKEYCECLLPDDQSAHLMPVLPGHDCALT